MCVSCRSRKRERGFLNYSHIKYHKYQLEAFAIHNSALSHMTENFQLIVFSPHPSRLCWPSCYRRTHSFVRLLSLALTLTRCDSMMRIISIDQWILYNCIHVINYLCCCCCSGLVLILSRVCVCCCMQLKNDGAGWKLEMPEISHSTSCQCALLLAGLSLAVEKSQCFFESLGLFSLPQPFFTLQHTLLLSYRISCGAVASSLRGKIDSEKYFVINFMCVLLHRSLFSPSISPPKPCWPQNSSSTLTSSSSSPTFTPFCPA